MKTSGFTSLNIRISKEFATLFIFLTKDLKTQLSLLIYCPEFNLY